MSKVAVIPCVQSGGKLRRKTEVKHSLSLAVAFSVWRPPPCWGKHASLRITSTTLPVLNANLMILQTTKLSLFWNVWWNMSGRSQSFWTIWKLWIDSSLQIGSDLCPCSEVARRAEMAGRRHQTLLVQSCLHPLVLRGLLSSLSVFGGKVAYWSEILLEQQRF